LMARCKAGQTLRRWSAPYPAAMALVTRTYLTDDLDDSEGDVSTVRLALDKVSYEIDLSAVNEARLRDKVAKFVDAATEVKAQSVWGKERKSAAAVTTRPDKEQSQVIREWAKSNGHKVSDRGRISAAIQEAFGAAH
jgi:Lsr2